jgi:hypothetical protein
LRRAATDSDVNYWANQFLSGMTVEQFYAQLLGSPEYYADYST